MEIREKNTRKYFKIGAVSNGEIEANAMSSEDMSLLTKGLGLNFIGHTTGAILEFLTHVALARFLGPNGFGLYMLGWTVMKLSRLVAGMGLERGVVRYGVRFWPEDPKGLKEVIFQAVGMTFVSGLIFAASIFFLAPSLADNVFKMPELTSVLRCFSVMIILIALMRVTAAATRITRLMHYSVFTVKILQPATCILMVVLFVGILKGGVNAAILTVGFSFFIATVWSIKQLRSMYSEIFTLKIRFSIYSKELLLFSLPTAMVGFLMLINQWLDRLFIGYFMTSADTGIYSAASQVSVLFGIITAMFNLTLGSFAANFFHRGQMDRLKSLYRMSTKWALYISMMIYLAIAIFPEPVIAIAFGTSYLPGTIPLVLLVTAHLLMIAPGSVGVLLIMSGNQNIWLAASSVSIVINIALNMLLIPMMGISGAALATGGSMAMLFAIGLILVKKRLDMTPYDNRYLKGIAAGIITAGLLFIWRYISPPSQVLTLAVGAFISTAAFLGTLIALGIDNEDREVLARVKRRLGRGNSNPDY